ncbi:MAG: TetR/AcrR family transcriptional regulator [Candidatus Eisenbacteria bacterium]|uniref:TetR/AcrR family transcriptional regulator n=1 Tax=Eiseniibacteriota bacterium TaxID=2212470 RepID=A0A948W7L2_UNCEI|nr:TetR/AcrR family transcriptional regulator [Candidatus Eisenbacteria bacterium]MBU1950381.1 TetR/AcrR family transcriptional regulator [Candidatus Eisenbacteria bacterium]MBU2691751.1 TetR/AcrR family transcriptional regulator [Candidatus Eisenbacteria bacterium]
MDKKKQILEAAQSLFARFGLKKVTTDDIARKASVSKATVYKYYSNKDEILADVVQLETEFLLLKIRNAVELETTALKKLRAYLLTKALFIRDLTNLYKVTRFSEDGFWPHIRDARVTCIIEENKILQSILKGGIETNELNVPRVDLTAHVLVISFRSLEFPWALEGSDLSIEEHIDQLLQVIYYGIENKAS